MPTARIVACGGKLLDDEAGPLRDFILSLARRKRPRVCFLPTASGDHPESIARFYRIAARLDCRPSDLPLFRREVRDLRAFLMEQDVVWVAGGNTANLLAVWRVHRLDELLREAWEAGCVMTGASAGMNCWFEASVTDSFALDQLAPLRDGLGWLAGSACPHYDGEPLRRPAYTELVASGALPPGVAADDCAALVYEGAELIEAVAARAGASAFSVTATGEKTLPARTLDQALPA